VKRSSHNCIPKNTCGVCIKDGQLTYNLRAINNAAFTIKFAHEEKLYKGSSILLHLLHILTLMSREISVTMQIFLLCP